MRGDIACPGCDLLLNIGTLQHGENASCPRCGNFLTKHREDAYERVLAFASAALMFLIVANSYSFLSFSASGMENTMTLRQTPIALWSHGLPTVAVLVAAFIIVIPSIILVLMLALCIPLRQGRYQPWLVPVAKIAFLAQKWAMVEVFIIGVIVSLVKIAAMATVEIGEAFWAYVAFTICFTAAVASLDCYQCWERIEALRGSKK